MESRAQVYKALNKIALLIMVLHIALPLIFWKQIPDQIPRHYDAQGVADAWSHKTSIILIYFVTLFMQGMFAIVNYFLKSSAESQHASVTDKRNYIYIYPMMVMSNIIIQILFAYITFCSVTSNNLGAWFLPVFLTGTFGTIFYYLWIYSKDRSSYEKECKGEYILSEDKAGECYRTKIDWWLFILLAGSLVLIGYFPIYEYITKNEFDSLMIITFIIMSLIILPLFRTRYILYSEHLTIICYGKLRIPYQAITGMKETYNPLSSAALSLQRIQIDFINEKGGHEMVLISPIHKKEFIRKVEAARLKNILENE